jgi:hypothetical protein
MAESTSAQNSDNSSTADPDAELVALVEKRLAAWALTHDDDDAAADDDDDAAHDETDRIDALIRTTPAHTLAGIRLKATLCREIACTDRFFGPEQAWPLLCSLMADLQHVPLEDQALLRSIFAELAKPLPP